MEADDDGQDFISRYKFPLALGVVGGVLLIGGVLSSGILNRTFKSSPQEIKTVNSNNQPIKVDIEGAVVSPGVYTLARDSRVEDLLKVSGGLMEEADPEFISKSLNLAQKLSDGVKIYIPYEGEMMGVVAGTSTGSSSTQVESQININTGSISDLDKLSGIGPVTAQKIIDKRPYAEVSELLSKRAVSKALYERIKAQIVAN